MNYQKVYMNQIFSSSLMGQVAELWRNQILCDAVIKTGSVDTKAHRLVIVAACPMLQHMENAALGAHLEVRLAADIKQEAVVTFLQYLYEGFMLLTEENSKDVEKIAKLLQVESVVKCCSDFNKCLSEKTGIPGSLNTRFTLKEQGDSVYVRTTDLLKVQEGNKRVFDDHSPVGSVNKRQKINLSTPPPPLLLPMLNIAHHNNERMNIPRDSSSVSATQNSPERILRANSGIPSLPQTPQNLTEVIEDSLEVLHREPPNPDDFGKSVEQPVQQTMSISVASQISNTSDVQVVNVTSSIPIAHSSSSVASSKRVHRPSASADRTNIPMTVLKSSIGSVLIDTSTKTDWYSSVNVDVGKTANVSHPLGHVQQMDTVQGNRSSFSSNSLPQEAGIPVLSSHLPTHSPSGQSSQNVTSRQIFPLPHSKQQSSSSLQNTSSFATSGAAPRLVTLSNPFTSGSFDRPGMTSTSFQPVRVSSPSTFRKADSGSTALGLMAMSNSGQSPETCNEPPDLSIVKQEDPYTEDSGGPHLQTDVNSDSKMVQEGPDDQIIGDESSNAESESGMSWHDKSHREQIQTTETVQRSKSPYYSSSSTQEAPVFTPQIPLLSSPGQNSPSVVPHRQSFPLPHSKQQTAGNMQHTGMFATAGVGPKLGTMPKPFAAGSSSQSVERQSLMPSSSQPVRVPSPSLFAARSMGSNRKGDSGDRTPGQTLTNKSNYLSTPTETGKDQGLPTVLKQEDSPETGSLELQIDLGDDSKASATQEGADDQIGDDSSNAGSEGGSLWQESTFRVLHQNQVRLENKLDMVLKGLFSDSTGSDHRKKGKTAVVTEVTDSDSIKQTEVANNSSQSSETHTSESHDSEQPSGEPFSDIPEEYRLSVDELASIKSATKNSGNFAKRLVAKVLFPELFKDDMKRREYSYNGGGIWEKKELDPVRKIYLKRYVTYFHPELNDIVLWKDHVIQKINEGLRRPRDKRDRIRKRKKDLATKDVSVPNTRENLDTPHPEADNSDFPSPIVYYKTESADEYSD